MARSNSLLVDHCFDAKNIAMFLMVFKCGLFFKQESFAVFNLTAGIHTVLMFKVLYASAFFVAHR